VDYADGEREAVLLAAERVRVLLHPGLRLPAPGGSWLLEGWLARWPLGPAPLLLLLLLLLNLAASAARRCRWLAPAAASASLRTAPHS
jgi:hypothetical protein